MRKLKIILKHLFVPHRSNAFRPHALRHKALTFYSTLLIFSQLFFGATMLSGPTITGADAKTVATNVIVKTNSERALYKLPSLSESEKLDQAAQEKLKDMFAKNYWDHNGPNGETAWQFIDGSGYRYQLAGENLAKGFDNSSEVVKAWMASPTHRENILNNNFTELGVAVGSGEISGRPTTIIVQLFGQPSVAYAQASYRNGVLGSTQLKPEVSLSNARIPSKLPYLALWTLLLGLVIVDGLMIRRLGLHASKNHIFNMRIALLMIGLGIGILMVGVVGIA